MGNPESVQSYNLFANFDNLDYDTKYTVGQFNVNGWFSNKNPYYTEFKLNVLKCMNVDIVVLCETHCINDQIININNYTVYQHDRKPQGGGRFGSGGVAIDLHNSLLFSQSTRNIQNWYHG